MITPMIRTEWIAAFIGHALRRGYADDPDWTHDVAEEVYPIWAGCDPEVAADSAFGVHDRAPGTGALQRTLH
jgi:hypothetical protein